MRKVIHLSGAYADGSHQVSRLTREILKNILKKQDLRQNQNMMERSRTHPSSWS
jgi:hypothetical protein